MDCLTKNMSASIVQKYTRKATDIYGDSRKIGNNFGRNLEDQGLPGISGMMSKTSR